jgi:16S rRNA (uracil1498-N3)-methyltransferase
MNRFFVTSSSFRSENVVLPKDRAHQIRNVLRLGPGDPVILLDNQGYEYVVALEEVGREQITGKVIERRPASGEPSAQVTLYQSLLARDKFEWVLQKCTEVGVTGFVPVVTSHTLVRDPDSVGPTKLDRWKRIITEAAEQSCRGRVPELARAVTFEEMLSDFDTYERCLIAQALGDGVALRDALHLGNNDPATVAVFIGPEGGFTEREVQLARAAGAVPVNLGRRILRTETAAVVATALVLYDLGQMEP